MKKSDWPEAADRHVAASGQLFHGAPAGAGDLEAEDIRAGIGRDRIRPELRVTALTFQMRAARSTYGTISASPISEE
ncbi:MAG: hypothetical protein C3F11_07255 [Methylocystaceae bacterium]|nr:MAG: hypothetical protein C3F11_07255 [Methylocystaceae bacterium]